MLKKIQELGTPIALTLMSVVFVVGLQISFETGRNYQAQLIEAQQMSGASIAALPLQRAITIQRQENPVSEILKAFQEKALSLLGKN